MGRKLYIGNLPYSTTEDDLRTMFAQAGNVDTVAVIMDRESGRSKGFGFVEMATDEEAKAAIAKCNGQTLGERQIIVDEARPQERKEGGGRPPRGGGGGRGFGGGGGGGGGTGWYSAVSPTRGAE